MVTVQTLCQHFQSVPKHRTATVVISVSKTVFRFYKTHTHTHTYKVERQNTDPLHNPTVMEHYGNTALQSQTSHKLHTCTNTVVPTVNMTTK